MNILYLLGRNIMDYVCNCNSIYSFIDIATQGSEFDYCEEKKKKKLRRQGRSYNIGDSVLFLK